MSLGVYDGVCFGRPPTRGEQTQPGSGGGAMDQSSIARTSIRLTRTTDCASSVGPRHGKVAEQRLGAGVERRIAIRFGRLLLPLLYLREKSHPAWLGMLPIFFLITPNSQSGSFRVTHDPRQHPQIRVGRPAVRGGKARNASVGKQLLWPGCA